MKIKNKTMNTIENNKLIAEFMGVESYEFRGYTMFVFEEDNHRPHIDLHYHTDWNWLMKVVEKIEGLVSSFTIKTYTLGNTYTDVTIIVNNDKIINIELELTKIEAVYNACVEFIKWYNEQPK